MKIHAITVSVDYAAELERSIGRWVRGLAQLVVVTAPRDEATIALARNAGADLHLTDVFWARGAMFNKGAAIQEARAQLPAEDWHLFVDADVVPPVDWLELLEAADPRPGVLHGARRRYEDGRKIVDCELAGFFQLFHSSDPRAAAPLACHFSHGGNYDSDFMLRWPRSRQRILSMELVHMGEPGINWCGRGNDEAMRRLRSDRARGRSWRTETIT